ncbi:hypothetical protein [Natronosalvus rutilus]|uniref:Uncharacterized protein n=1 Tax=Natronosalvus rutilus TaxID=2953753 RepID=A0A9E7NDW5_9EURY|nr:hypothetical protein [Natronosalvus rutilus]UTF55159.1 hypothetical protein NGM29_07890 [Natronosalvus rutilus]
MTTETDDRITKLLTNARAALDDLGIRETADESDADDEAGGDGGDGGDERRPLELTADLEGGAQDGLPEPISSTDLPSLAEEAHELVEEGDVQSLLERVGLDTLPDGSAPSSLPEAIANGDPGQVATLRALQRLASLADPDPDSDPDLDDADSLEETVLDLYGLLTKSVAVETGDEEASEADTEASDDADEPDEEEGEAAGDETDEDESGEDEMDEEGEADQKDEDETDESEESTSESDSEPAEATDETDSDETDEADETDGDSDLEDSISSALKDAVGGFGDEVESLKAGLEAAGLGDDKEADAEDEADTEDEEANGDDTDEENGDERDEADDAEEDEDEDDSLLSTGDDGGPFGGSSSRRRRGTMYSTVARSPSKRADMKATTRHSTMPKRN